MVKFFGSWKTVKGSLLVMRVLLEEEVGDKVAGFWCCESRESLSIDSVGGTGETTSVMMMITDFAEMIWQKMGRG